MDADFPLPEPFGYHLSLDAYECDGNTMLDEGLVRRFLKTLASSIKMKIHESDRMSVQVEVFGNSPKTLGVTGWCPLTDSGITIHTVNATGNLYLDVFSCCQYDCSMVERVVTDFFEPAQMRTNYRVR